MPDKPDYNLIAAEKAYVVYKGVVDNTTPFEISTWENLSSNFKGAWMAAAQAANQYYNKIVDIDQSKNFSVHNLSHEDFKHQEIILNELDKDGR